MMNVLIIGGTGVIGKPLVAELIRNNIYNIYSIALDKTNFPSIVKQYVADRTTNEYKDLIQKLNSEINQAWDAVIDIIAFDEKSTENTYTLFKGRAQHIITISTTLVYDRTAENTEKISEDNPLAPKGKFGGYVDGKVSLEKFWHSITNVNWTLLRPYHILGAESLLGCIPEHNRDPKLIERIKNNEALKLCNGGNINFNYVHPKDIATAICKIIGNATTFGQAYNLVNPKIITAKNYYTEIARQIGSRLTIENVDISTVWEEMKGWEMTTLPHVYAMEKIKRDIGITPNIPIEKGIEDAIMYPAKVLQASQIPVHQRMNKPSHPLRPAWLK